MRRDVHGGENSYIRNKNNVGDEEELEGGVSDWPEGYECRQCECNERNRTRNHPIMGEVGTRP